MSVNFRSNRFVGIVLFAAAAVLFAYIWFSPWSHRELRDGFTLGFFPLIGVGAMGLCALVMVFDPLRDEIPEDLETASWGDVVQAVLLLLGIGIYAHFMRALGFVVLTPLFLFSYMLWMGVRPLSQAILLSLTVPIGIYVLFTLLGVELPAGLLSAIL